MTPKGKKRAVVITLLLVGAGIGGYFLWQKYGKKKEEEVDVDEDVSVSTDDYDYSPPKSSSGSSSDRPTDSATISDFQEYANSQGASLKVDGIWGSNTQSAWNSYGEAYKSRGAKAEQEKGVQSESYKAAAKAMGLRAKNRGTYTTLLSKPKHYGLSGNEQVYLVVNNEGIWRVFYIPAGKTLDSKKMISKGRYYKGGKRLVVGWGKNKGVIFEGSSFGNNLQKVLKS